ncbi:MAG: TetR/AcrR family transcriptional regulator [Bilifractor sp.]
MRIKGLNEQLIQQYIAEALLILMEKKPYGKISIGEICEKAGVNRSSYYRHFEVKEDIIHFYLMSLMEEYQREYEQQEHKTFRSYTLQIFTTFYSHRKALLLIHRNGLSYIMLEVFNECFQFGEIPDEVGSLKKFEVAYHIGGIYNDTLLWLSHGMKETPEQMTEITLSFRPEGSFTLLNVK